MKKLIVFLALIFSVISCDKKEENVPVFLYNIKSDFPENYMLNSENQNSFIQFIYSTKADAVPKIDIKYVKEQNLLLLRSDTLFQIKSTFKPRNTEFKMYQTKQKRSHITTYVFNEEYGLFASLGFKSHQLFLKDSISAIEKETIFKGIFIELNKTYLE